jgi:hypothetical protein
LGIIKSTFQVTRVREVERRPGEYGLLLSWGVCAYFHLPDDVNSIARMGTMASDIPTMGRGELVVNPGRDERKSCPILVMCNRRVNASKKALNGI